MDLCPTQKALYLHIVENSNVLARFTALVAEFEAALDETEDPDRTAPLGVTAVLTEIERSLTDPVEAASAVAIAWLDMIAEAVALNGGEMSPHIFDDDGVSAFCDTRPLFMVARACGYGESRARRAFARVRRGAASVPSRALQILGPIGVIKVAKRREAFRRVNRVVALAAPFACNLAHDEIARAKAGGLVYSLIARKECYEAVRVRKMKPRSALDSSGAPIDIVSEGDIDVMDGFDVPLVPCEELHATALDQFVQFLDEQSDRKHRNTYQRLVHRTHA
ncbi:MAG: hypothetical protein AAB554_04850 [Patescibacteria group bacterium]